MSIKTTHMLRQIVVAAMLALFVTMSAAATKQFGTVQYSVPDNWKTGRVDEGSFLLRSDFPDDYCRLCLIKVSNGQPLQGTLVQWLEKHLEDLVDSDEHKHIELQAKPKLSDLAGKPAAIGIFRTRSKLHFQLAIESNQQVFHLSFEGRARNKQELKETGDTFSKSALPFFSSLTFVNPGESAVMPAAIPGDMEGIYWGVDFYLSTQLDGSMYTKTRHRRFVFFKDGHFYEGSPPEGTSGINRDALLAAANTDFGVYERRGNTIKLTYASGDSDKYEKDGEQWKKGRVSLRSVEPVEDGLRIDGVLSSFNYTGFAAGGAVSGGVASASSTTFFLDGSYEGQRVGTSTSSTVTTISRRNTGGTYEIANSQIVMTPSDGGAPTQELIFKLDDSYMLGEKILD